MQTQASRLADSVVGREGVLNSLLIASIMPMKKQTISCE